MAEYPDHIRIAQTLLSQQGEINALKAELATVRTQLEQAYVTIRAFVEPGDTAVAAPAEPEVELNYHYGPTADDPRAGAMWHYGCGGEVWFIDSAPICTKCKQQGIEGQA